MSNIGKTHITQPKLPSSGDGGHNPSTAAVWWTIFKMPYNTKNACS